MWATIAIVKNVVKDEVSFQAGQFIDVIIEDDNNRDGSTDFQLLLSADQRKVKQREDTEVFFNLEHDEWEFIMRLEDESITEKWGASLPWVGDERRHMIKQWIRE